MHNVPYDGECGFSAIGHQMFANQYCSAELPGYVVRREIVNFVSNNENLKSDISPRLVGQTIDQYLSDMRNATTWIDEDMIFAASILYNSEIRILKTDNTDPLIIGTSTCGRTVTLGYTRCAPGEKPSHYVSLVHHRHPNVDASTSLTGKFTGVYCRWSDAQFRTFVNAYSLLVGVYILSLRRGGFRFKPAMVRAV